MKKRSLIFLIIICNFLFLGLDTPTQELYSLFEKFQPSYAVIHDYTARLEKRELVKGKWQEEVLEFAFKKPFQIKIKWLSGPKKGRRILFVEGANQNKLFVKVGGTFGGLVPTLKLDPNGNLASDDAGHTIREAGLGYMAEEIWKVTRQAYERGNLSLKSLETHDPGVLKIERRISGMNLLVVTIDRGLGIPVSAERFDSEDRLFASYFYKVVRVNQGLSDDEFGPNHL